MVEDRQHHPALLCRRDALRPPLADAGALVLYHKGRHLKHNVAEKSVQQVLTPSGVQQGHSRLGLDFTVAFAFGATTRLPEMRSIIAAPE